MSILDYTLSKMSAKNRAADLELQAQQEKAARDRANLSAMLGAVPEVTKQVGGIYETTQTKQKGDILERAAAAFASDKESLYDQSLSVEAPMPPGDDALMDVSPGRDQFDFAPGEAETVQPVKAITPRKPFVPQKASVPPMTYRPAGVVSAKVAGPLAMREKVAGPLVPTEEPAKVTPEGPETTKDVLSRMMPYLTSTPETTKATPAPQPPKESLRPTEAIGSIGDLNLDKLTELMSGVADKPTKFRLSLDEVAQKALNKTPGVELLSEAEQDQLRAKLVLKGAEMRELRANELKDIELKTLEKVSKIADIESKISERETAQLEKETKGYQARAEYEKSLLADNLGASDVLEVLRMSTDAGGTIDPAKLRGSAGAVAEGIILSSFGPDANLKAINASSIAKILENEVLNRFDLEKGVSFKEAAQAWKQNSADLDRNLKRSIATMKAGAKKADKPIMEGARENLDTKYDVATRAVDIMERSKKVDVGGHATDVTVLTAAITDKLSGDVVDLAGAAQLWIDAGPDIPREERALRRDAAQLLLKYVKAQSGATSTDAERAAILMANLPRLNNPDMFREDIRALAERAVGDYNRDLDVHQQTGVMGIGSYNPITLSAWDPELNTAWAAKRGDRLIEEEEAARELRPLKDMLGKAKEALVGPTVPTPPPGPKAPYGTYYKSIMPLAQSALEGTKLDAFAKLELKGLLENAAQTQDLEKVIEYLRKSGYGIPN